jgi:hypothetical protein
MGHNYIEKDEMYKFNTTRTRISYRKQMEEMFDPLDYTRVTNTGVGVLNVSWIPEIDAYPHVECTASVLVECVHNLKFVDWCDDYFACIQFVKGSTTQFELVFRDWRYSAMYSIPLKTVDITTVQKFD